jgi:hypothetical protein
VSVTTLQAKTLLENDPDFIYSKRHNYSLAELKKRHPEGCPDRLVAAVLLITEDDVDARYTRIVETLRAQLTDSL